MKQRIRPRIRAYLEVWKRVGKRIGDFQARLILTLFYFFIFGPFALVLRLASDPLGITSGGEHGWVARRDREGGLLERARKQF